MTQYKASPLTNIYAIYAKNYLVKKLAAEFLDNEDLNELIKPRNMVDSPEKIREKNTKFNYWPISIKIGAHHPDTFRLGEFVPPNNARHVLIVTRHRSGSSFLGDLLSRLPGTFYSYEPLTFKTPDRISLLKEVFKCYQNKNYFQHAKMHWAYSKNFRLWNTCKSLVKGDNLCFMKELYYSTCEMFPMRLIKTIRLSIQESEELLLDQEIGKTLKIIFLVRDPRGVFHSLKSRAKWCDFWKEACDLNWHCQSLQNDLTDAYKIKEKHPG